ncbi:MAG: transcriptional regulator [Propionibacteriaceae bacterium]|nr:transcriptional regulator [Propionibacteriaceae bacterium]
MKIQTDTPISSAAQDATTRHRVMKYIVEHGWTTSSTLATEFGLTTAAIRRHLSHLEATGILASRPQSVAMRQGAGRPSKEYTATAQGRETFSQAYDTFAISAIESLSKLGGEQAVTEFFEARFAAIEARFAELRALDPGLSESEALSVALTEDGFMVGLAPVGQGEQLCQHNCPYPAIATRFPELCSVETSVFSRLLHSHVQRLATIAHGDGVCTTHIPYPTRKEKR